MKLDEFTKEAVVEIMRGIDTSDKELRESNLGSIYRGQEFLLGPRIHLCSAADLTHLIRVHLQIHIEL